MRRSEHTHSLKQQALFKVLELFTGHSRPLDERPAPRRRRNQLGEPSTPRRIASNYQPPPVFEHLPPRSHCLTPPPSSSDSSYLQQTQSILFNVPAEIRLRIYEEVLGESLLHIVRRKGRLGDCLCKVGTPGRQGECIENECRGLKLPSGLHVKSRSVDEGVVGLLQTCRKV